jgi:hypothetical protein
VQNLRPIESVIKIVLLLGATLVVSTVIGVLLGVPFALLVIFLRSIAINI